MFANQGWVVFDGFVSTFKGSKSLGRGRRSFGSMSLGNLSGN